MVLVAGHNIAQNTFLNETGYELGNALVAASLIGLGRSSGSSMEEMGLVPKIPGGEMRLVAAAATTLAVSTIAAVAHPETRTLLLDERARDVSPEIVRHNVLIRFPLGTALFEEIVFRGVLPRLLARSDSTGNLLSSALFALWHVIPTARVMRGNALGRRASHQARAVAAGSFAAGAAGYVLATFRRRSGSVAVPWLLHSVFNVTSYLGGVIAWRLDRRS